MPTTPAAQPQLPVNYLDDPATYKGKLDGNAAAYSRIAANFTPFALPVPTMKVLVGPGHLQTGVTLVEQGTNTTGNTAGTTAVTLTGPTSGIANGNAVIGIPATTINVTATTHTSTTADGITTGTSQAWIGCTVTGTGVQVGTTVTAVGAGSITLSLATTTSVTGAVLLIQSTNPIPAGTTVAGISGTALTLSGAATTTTTGVKLMICQVTGTITAPGSNSRIDRVVGDVTTGAISVITGTPGASPAVPAITAGKFPICQILLTSTTTSINNSMITPEVDLTAVAIASSSVAITGGTVNGVVIGGTTKAAGGFTALTATGTTTLATALTGPLKAASGVVSAAAIDLSGSEVTGNLGVAHLNSGTGATSTSYWRGDGTWATVTVPVVTQGSFSSGITAGGTLAENTSNGLVPTMTWLEARCNSTDGGFAVNDIIQLPPYGYQGSNLGFTAKKVASPAGALAYIGTATNPFSAIATSGATFVLANAKWDLRLCMLS